MDESQLSLWIDHRFDSNILPIPDFFTRTLDRKECFKVLLDLVEFYASEFHSRNLAAFHLNRTTFLLWCLYKSMKRPLDDHGNLSLNVYKDTRGRWVFDDPAKRIHQEPFVSGMEKVLNHLSKDIPNAGFYGFILHMQEGIGTDDHPFVTLCHAEPISRSIQLVLLRGIGQDDGMDLPSTLQVYRPHSPDPMHVG